MIQKYNDIIDKLKISNSSFAEMFHEHNNLNFQINKLSRKYLSSAKKDEIQKLKTKKLELKDKLYKIITNALNENETR